MNTQTKNGASEKTWFSGAAYGRADDRKRLAPQLAYSEPDARSALIHCMGAG